MGRKPLARQKILDASRQIVMERGAGCLTFDEIAAVSGVTRGGITYHFPTKQELLQALVDHDLEQWRAIESELRPKGFDEATADLLASIRSYTHKHQDRRRFVSGMLGAATLDPPILEPARDYEQRRMAGVEWSDAVISQYLLRMAAVGIFWSDLFDCPSIPADVRTRLVKLLEQLAVEWSTDNPNLNKPQQNSQEN
ncbi:MAG: TetR/AcrR family transcriptional regulator [Woeseia sp.]|nr:TetR/AcrR family transcriptional regulator [Woeseia sp.]MBT8097812.1 TetR/AcrR family transcriptional regulator [Woeseia sp.]NNE59702.1 TetR/AcrR family transcriptional regulator [Woeseia sp.]NNL54237.1 TetR/AcrR family transcriptional regulator [Woeseia sp.]